VHMRLARLDVHRPERFPAAATKERPAPADTPDVFWWFEREGAFRRCDPVALNDRQQKIMDELTADGWSWVI